LSIEHQAAAVFCVYTHSVSIMSLTHIFCIL